MNKTDPPQTFGVFKPVGHTAIAYGSEADMQLAVNKLGELGFVASEMVRYSSTEMMALVEAQLLSASPLAAFGYELDIMKANRILAHDGCSFLIVEALEDESAKRVAVVARTTNAIAAQHYGTFMIEELLERLPQD